MAYEKRNRAIVSLSGGMDSATVLAYALESGYNVARAVGFHYGSKHNPRELEAAEALAKHYKVPFSLLDISSAMGMIDSHLMADNPNRIPEGYYEGENMRQTVVPGRNLIFASILAGIAWTAKAQTVFMGIHSGDHFIYPDCRPEFFKHMKLAVESGTDGAVSLAAPFLFGNKETILTYGISVGVPYEMTRTCYTSNEMACGRCGSCQERLAAWVRINQEDPIEYEERALLPKKS